MDVGNGKEDFPWVGANCSVYDVNALIVVKVPKHGDENMNSSAEVEIFLCGVIGDSLFRRFCITKENLRGSS